MGFEKVVETQIWGVTVQNSELRTVTGDSTGGTFTGRINPLRGSLMWDRCMFVLQDVVVAGGATGGSYSITIETDAVIGYTGLPIARVTGVGPESNTTIIMDNLHQSPSSPLPTHLFIDQTATGGGLTLTCHVIAKQYRGDFGVAAQGSAERIAQGTMLAGNSSTVDFSGDEGISADTTFTIGTSGSLVGMNRLRLWDNAMFWAVQNDLAGGAIGTHDVDIVATIGGNTVSIATTGTGGALDIVADSTSHRVAIPNSYFGLCPRPSTIIWTEVDAGGVSDPRIVFIAKAGRGSLAKR